MNPVLPGDFQNTDVLRVGKDFYYISATKVLSPGMMVLHSRDLVNWQIIGHVVPDITIFNPRFNYDRMEGPERGIWAGALAFHRGRFFVYFTTPDEGLYVSTAANPAGPWSNPECMLRGAGWDDPGPLWDDDGQAYLALTNFATDPRDGKAYHIHLFKMTPYGNALLPNFDVVIHQSRGSEANKLYKVHGRYFHFFSEVTAEGRVPMIGRSRDITGPYEVRQLNHVHHETDREPNQGTLLNVGKSGDTRQGAWFFMTHHGVNDWEGRPASLLPVTWRDGWPVAGSMGADGVGNMVWIGKKPIPGSTASLPQTSDEFRSPLLSPQWEWFFQPRPDRWSLRKRPGYLRLRPLHSGDPGNLLKVGNILTQRPFSIRSNVAVVEMDVAHLADGQTAGLCFLGKIYSAVGIAQRAGTRRLVFNHDGTITTDSEVSPAQTTLWLQARWDASGHAQFSTSNDGKVFLDIGPLVMATNFGAFLGAKIGIYTVNDTDEDGYVDVASFRYSYRQ